MTEYYRCSSCEVTYPDSEYVFEPRGDKPAYRRKSCNRCRATQRRYHLNKSPEQRERDRERSKAWRERNPERSARGIRNATIRAKYGLTPDEYDAMWSRQNGRCAICGGTDPKSARGGVWLHVDHDHVTSTVRGLLCRTCNLALGYLNDDPQLLESAADYLRSHK